MGRNGKMHHTGLPGLRLMAWVQMVIKRTWETSSFKDGNLNLFYKESEVNK